MPWTVTGSCFGGGVRCNAAGIGLGGEAGGVFGNKGSKGGNGGSSSAGFGAEAGGSATFAFGAKPALDRVGAGTKPASAAAEGWGAFEEVPRAVAIEGAP